MGSIGNHDWIKIRGVLRRHLERVGPQTSVEMVAHFEGRLSRTVVHMALRFLAGDGEIFRLNNRHPWSVVERVKCE